jgi:hypothetical protein
MHPLTALEVTAHDSAYCLSWERNRDHYHVWLNRGDFSVQPGVGSNGKGLYKRIGDSQKVAHLDHTVLKNGIMIGRALSEARAAKLFHLCDQHLAEAEKKRLAQAAEEYKVTLAQQAGPQMLVVLKAISEFWKEGGDRQPLDPGALIFDSHSGNIPFGLTQVPLNFQTALSAVRAVVKLAEQGEGVPL